MSDVGTVFRRGRTAIGLLVNSPRLLLIMLLRPLLVGPAWQRTSGFIWTVTCLIYTFLPFRTLFGLSVRFRALTDSADLARHFDFYCGPGCQHDRAWLIDGSLAMKYRNETFFYMIVSGHDELAIAIFPKLRWPSLGNDSSDRIGRFLEKYGRGYRSPFVMQLHRIDWIGLYGLPARELRVFLQTMIEHRVFEHEERIFRGTLSLRKMRSESLSLPHYVAFFFQDRQLVDDLFDDLDLGSSSQVLETLSLEGRHWEKTPDLLPEPATTRALALFYAQRHLLLHTYHAGSGHLVGPIFKRTLALQERIRGAMPRPSDELRATLADRGVQLESATLFSPDWSALIGHNGHLAVHMQMRELGWWSGTPILLADKDRIANRPFLSLFDETCNVMYRGENISAGAWDELASLMPFISTSHQAFCYSDGRAVYWNDAGGAAVHAWEGENRGFPLRERWDRLVGGGQADEELEALKKGWGMGPGDWYVCLHMRDSATRGETAGAGESIRSTTFDHYVDAIRHVTEAGGFVVRMGSPMVAPMPDMPRLVDYARHPAQTPLMDIHLMRHARMFIGTTSGFAYVASNFGVPTAMVNALSSVGLLWSTNTRFALKQVGLRKEGRLLSQREVTSERWRWAFPTHECLAEAGLVVADSTPDEILETVREVMQILDTDGRPAETPLLDRWKRSLSIPAFYGAASPSRYFLEKHAEVFLDA